MKVPVVVMLSFLPTLLGASSGEAAPKMVAIPLSQEQIAVYQAFLKAYENGSRRVIKLADKTQPIEPDDKDYAGCLNDFPYGAKVMEIHRLPPSLEHAGAVYLVDPTQHRIVDPEDAMRKDVSPDKALGEGISGGLLSISEIIFDTSHRHAALTYFFHCGKLCGSGGIVIMDFNAGKWSESRQSCRVWKS